MRACWMDSGSPAGTTGGAGGVVFAVAGVPHTRPAEIRRRVGVLPESAGYPGKQTGDEYLRYFGRLFGHSRQGAREVAARLLAQVGLADRGHSLIASYSRGMRQRLGIARALVNDPQVIFLDEPTLGLDPAGQRQVLALVRGITAERGASTPALAVTAYDTEYAASAAQDAGFNAYLTKPLRLDLLATVVKELAARSARPGKAA